MDRITEPTPNTPLSASWGRSVTRALNRLHISGGRGVLVSQDAHGVNISLAPAIERHMPPQWDCVVVAQITGGTTLTGYDITCYPAYPSTAGSYAAKLAVPEIALGTELPVNTYIIAHKKAVEIMGGTPA